MIYTAEKNNTVYKIEVLNHIGVRYTIKGNTNIIIVEYFGGTVHIHGKNATRYTTKKDNIYKRVRKMVLDAIF